MDHCYPSRDLPPVAKSYGKERPDYLMVHCQPPSLRDDGEAAFEATNAGKGHSLITYHLCEILKSSQLLSRGDKDKEICARLPKSLINKSCLTAYLKNQKLDSKAKKAVFRCNAEPDETDDATLHIAYRNEHNVGYWISPLKKSGERVVNCIYLRNANKPTYQAYFYQQLNCKNSISFFDFTN